MSTIATLRMYSRFARGLPGFLRHPISLEEARAAIRQGLIDREANFLRLARRGIFGNPRSPYRPLLKLAGCELGDIEASVHSKGLEPTLQALREAGVYFTFEEYKGRQPVVRNGQVIPVSAQDFDNPHTARVYEGETGGSTGRAGTRVATDLDHMASQVPHLMLWRDAHGVLDAPMAIWRGILPDPTGVGTCLRAARHRDVPQRWFAPITREDYTPSLKNRLATYYIIAMGRLCGVPFPRPEPVRLDQAGVVAQWAADTVRAHGRSLLQSSVSLAVRICLAAQEEGLDLTGVTFMGGGEPVTSAKMMAITRTGARFVPSYISVDTGLVGLGCTRPAGPNDLHLMKDCVALIQHPRRILDSSVTVDAFYFTTLRPTAPKILLNIESDDYGVVERRACGCPLEACGFTEHVREVQSFGKLTGEGVTLVGSEMTHILEEVLPARFGGSPLDFQLIEEEDEVGLSRLTLLVSPRIDIPPEEVVVEAVLAALGKSSDAADLARAFWQQAGTLRVKRAEPVWTARGKLLPIRVGGRFVRAEPTSAVSSNESAANQTGLRGEP